MSSRHTGVSRTKGSAVHPSVDRGLSKLGVDLASARRARRIPTTDMAARMGVSRSTLHRLEKGDPGVSLNTLAMALSVLGLFDRLADLADPASDDLGLALSRKNLPRRVVTRRPKRSSPGGMPGSEPRGSGRADDGPEGW